MAVLFIWFRELQIDTTDHDIRPPLPVRDALCRCAILFFSHIKPR